MKHIVALSMLITSISIGTTATASESSMRPGQWEVTTQTEMVGVPMQIPATKDMSCITAEEINKPFMGEMDAGCTLEEIEKTANTHKWKLACTENGQKMTGTGTFTFSAESYSGVMEMSMTQDGQVMNMKTTLTGKRVGDC
ncbi:DUF3617 domain-containing protein [Orrella marina]|nr:DUF3617 domain-containing protein [Orrella marina]